MDGKGVRDYKHSRRKLLRMLLLISHSVVSDSLQPHGLQHARLPCPSPTPGAYSNTCPLSWWCHPSISSSVALFSSCPQFFPGSGSFPVSLLLASGGQSIAVSVLVSVLPMNIQDWFLLELTGLISLQTNGLSRDFSSTTGKASVLWHSAFFMVYISHPHMTTGKTIALTIWNFVGKLSAFYYAVYICHSFYFIF